MEVDLVLNKSECGSSKAVKTYTQVKQQTHRNHQSLGRVGAILN
jgi:hypothetical protein